MALQRLLHPNLDLFIADLSTWSLKDEQAGMEHPMFSLAKTPDFTPRHYEHRGTSITVAPNALFGMPTIWDKDVLIYCWGSSRSEKKIYGKPQVIAKQ